MHTPIHIFQRYELIFSMSVFSISIWFLFVMLIIASKTQHECCPCFHRYTQCYTTSFIFLCYEYINFFPSFNLIRFFFFDNRFPALFVSVELLDPRMRPLCVALF